MLKILWWWTDEWIDLPPNIWSLESLCLQHWKLILLFFASKLNCTQSIVVRLVFSSRFLSGPLPTLWPNGLWETQSWERGFASIDLTHTVLAPQHRLVFFVCVVPPPLREKWRSDITLRVSFECSEASKNLGPVLALDQRLVSGHVVGESE